MTLTTAAPSGGITIDLSTSDRDFARPASSTVTVPSGSTSATFRIETTTVGESKDIQITARYQNVAINQILRVTIPPPVPRFTITGAARGASGSGVVWVMDLPARRVVGRVTGVGNETYL